MRARNCRGILRHGMAVAAGAAAMAMAQAASAEPAKNIILMISDGAGFNAFKAASYFQFGQLGMQAYDQADWQKFAMTTYPLNLSSKPTGLGAGTVTYGNMVPGDTVKTLAYNPVDAWDATPVNLVVPEYYLDANKQPVGPGSSGAFAGYNYVKSTWTDSAAAVTAMATGQKTYNNALNWSDSPKDTGSPVLPTIVDIAESLGKATGTISTVQWAHATPAGMSNAHSISRNNYADLANQMLNGNMEVIMGAGHPLYNDNNVIGPNEHPDPAKVKDGLADGQDYQYVGGKNTWESLVNGTHASGRTLIQTKTDFEALAAGTYNGGALPTKLVGTAQVFSTMQYGRSATADWNGDGVFKPLEYENFAQVTDWDGMYSPVNPGDDSAGDPFNSGVPSLATMAKAALNVLDKNPNGFFLHIEGGAVDWAGHGNSKSRLIEEQIDFNKAVEAVVWYLDNNTNGNNWLNTLLIIAADHETGLLWGPNSDTVAYEALVNNGAGVMPGMRFNTDNHTGTLVPLYARGANASMFSTFANGYDALAELHFGVGRYLDNTDVFRVMSAAVPEPTVLTGLVFGLAGLMLRRGRRV